MSFGKQAEAEAEAGINKNYTEAQESSFRTQSREREKQLRIYGVTEGIQSKHSRITYQQNFDRFLNKINIHDLQVLLDFSKNRPQIIKEMIVDYIRYLSEEKEIRRNSIKTQIAPIIRFFRINNDDFNLRMDNFKLHLPPDESVNEDRAYTRDEIASILRSCDVRSRVMILLLCSTGMRILLSLSLIQSYQKYKPDMQSIKRKRQRNGRDLAGNRHITSRGLSSPSHNIYTV